METKTGGNFSGGGFKRYLMDASDDGFRHVALFLVPLLKSEMVTGTMNKTKKSGVKFKRPSKSGAKTHTTFSGGAPTGGPPWKRSGAGQTAIGFELGDGGLRVGVSHMGIHMAYLEQGVHYPTHGPNKGSGENMQWPWLVPTVEKNLTTIERLFLEGGKK